MDQSSDVFRITHLSVREYFEEKVKYNEKSFSVSSNISIEGVSAMIFRLVYVTRNLPFFLEKQ
jgi:hypothetical protein